MNYQESAIVNTSRTRTNKETKINHSTVKFYPFASKYGLIAGALMSLFVFLTHLGDGGGATGLQFFKYIILGGVLYYALSFYKKSLNKVSIFKEDMQLGGMITVVAALTLLAANFLFFSFGLGVSKFNVETVTFPDFALIGGTEFFMTLVFGMVLTFICLQGLKERSSK